MGVKVSKVNEVFMRIDAESGILAELSERFTFFAPNYKHHPKFKSRVWDGKIRLLNLRNRQLYMGLLAYVEAFCAERDYEFETTFDASQTAMSVKEAEEFKTFCNIPEKYESRDYQIDTFIDCVRHGRRLFVSPTACHKATDLVFCETGWKCIKDIRIGEKVFGIDGKLKEVLKLHQGKDILYEVVPKTKRNSITVTGEHLLCIKHTDSKEKYGYSKGDPNKIEHITVKEYIQKSKYYKHCSVLPYNNIPLEFNQPNADTSLTPYFIGIYLGDGSTNSIAVTTKDIEIVQEIENIATLFGCSIRQNGMTFNIVKQNDSATNPIREEFSKVGLHFKRKDRTTCEEKFIPQEYMCSDIGFRYDLLAGLIDSDGHLNNGTHFEFISKSIKLANDVATLSISLGLIAHTYPKFNKRYNRTYYKTTIMGDIHKVPTRLKRKQAVKYTRNRNPYVSKFDVKKLDKQPYYGLTVEDQLYITNGGMITHNSGKSMIIYQLLRYYMSPANDSKILIVVPRIGLIKQMVSDFTDYGFDSEKYVHPIFGGEEKVTNKPIVLTTWQSIVDMPKSWFSQFHMVVGDEAHNFKAVSLIKIMSALETAKYRFGFTGSLDDEKTNKITLEGLFGPFKQLVTTKELMDSGHVSDLDIKIIQFTYSDEICKTKRTYEEEYSFIISNRRRNEFIINLALSLPDTTLVLFRIIEHGKELMKMLENKGRTVHLIYGAVDAELREEVRKKANEEAGSIILASVGTFSEGINIPNLHNIISTSPTKSRVKVMQTIGRGIRKTETKTNCTFFDLGDDLHWKNRKNYTLIHLLERIKLYHSEKFQFKIYKVKLKDD